MVTCVDGDLFSSEAGALVNPVNLEGVMGAGLALEFKRRFPTSFEIYRAACRQGHIDIGVPLFTTEVHQGRPIWVVALPTKREWRRPSRLAYVENGLHGLVLGLGARGVTSVALPALGCGLGGLLLYDVAKLVNRILGPTDLDVEFYLPRQ